MTLCMPQISKPRELKRRKWTKVQITAGVATLLGLAAIQAALIWRYVQKPAPVEHLQEAIAMEVTPEAPTPVSRIKASQSKISVAKITAGEFTQAMMPVPAEIATYKTMISSKDGFSIINEDDANDEPIRALAPVSNVTDGPPRVTIMAAEVGTGSFTRFPSTSYLPPRLVSSQVLPMLMAGLAGHDLPGQIRRSGKHLFVAAMPATVDKASVRMPANQRDMLPPMPPADAIVAARKDAQPRRIIVPQARLSEVPDALLLPGLSGGFPDTSEAELAGVEEILGKSEIAPSVRQSVRQWIAAANAQDTHGSAARADAKISDFQKELSQSGLSFDDLFALGRTTTYLSGADGAMPFYRVALEKLQAQQNSQEILRQTAVIRNAEIAANTALFLAKDPVLAEQVLNVLADAEKPGSLSSRRALYHYAAILLRQDKKPNDALIVKLQEASAFIAPERERQEIQWMLGQSLFVLERYDESLKELLPIIQAANPTYVTQPAYVLSIRSAARTGNRQCAQELLSAWDQRFRDLTTDVMFRELQAEIAKTAPVGSR